MPTESPTSEPRIKLLVRSEPLAGHFAGLLFATGIVGLGLLAVPVLAGSTAYAAAEATHRNEGLSRHFREARGFYTVIIGSMLLGLALDFGGLDPDPRSVLRRDPERRDRAAAHPRHAAARPVTTHAR